MLARAQQIIALALAFATLIAFALGARSANAWLGLVPPLVAAGSYAAVLAVEFWLLGRSYSGADAARPTSTQLLRAWSAEMIGGPRVFLWRQPFASRRVPDRLQASARGCRGVLLVHGFFCNRGLWNPLLRRLRAAQIPFVAVNLEPVFGSIDSYRETIASGARRLEAATGLAPVVLAHSMGGLAVRAWLTSDAEARAHRLITIASPHGGTRLTRRSRRANLAQMAESSAWLTALAAREAARPRQPVVCFWSHCDNIVVPSRNATLGGADNRHLESTPHVQMIFHPAVMAEVLQAVAASS